MKHKEINVVDIIEDIYLKNRIVLSVFTAAIITILFHLNIIVNVRASISNLIDLTAALMVIITLILTLLLYLNDKETYVKRLERHKAGKKQIFLFMFKIAVANILTTCILIMIDILEISSYIFILIITFFGAYLFSYMMFGAIYMLWFAIFIVIGLDNEKEKVP